MAGSDGYQPSFHVAVIHAHHLAHLTSFYRCFSMSLYSTVLVCYGSATIDYLRGFSFLL